MLDCDSQREQLETAIRGLKCLLSLPPEYTGDVLGDVQMPSVPGCERRFSRIYCPGPLVPAGFRYQPSIAAVAREPEWYRVYMVNLSRGGLQILHHEQVFPGEHFEIGLLDGSRRLCRAAWCHYLNHCCYRVGAAFVKESSEASAAD